MPSPSRKATQIEKEDAPRRFVFLLLDKFTMINFAGAIEPLRLANHVMGHPIYTWALCGEGGIEKTCSNGATFRLDFGLDEVERDDTILVCGGIDVQRATTKPISWAGVASPDRIVSMAARACVAVCTLPGSAGRAAAEIAELTDELVQLGHLILRQRLGRKQIQRTGRRIAQHRNCSGRG